MTFRYFQNFTLKVLSITIDIQYNKTGTMRLNCLQYEDVIQESKKYTITINNKNKIEYSKLLFLYNLHVGYIQTQEKTIINMFGKTIKRCSNF